jgi:hypothetical protein
MFLPVESMSTVLLALALFIITVSILFWVLLMKKSHQIVAALGELSMVLYLSLESEVVS